MKMKASYIFIIIGLGGLLVGIIDSLGICIYGGVMCLLLGIYSLCKGL